MTNFSDVLDKAKKMQEKMQEAQDLIKKIEVQGVAGGDQVKLSLDGNGDLVKLIIDPNLMKEQKEILEDLIIAAHNDAKEKLKSRTSEEISKITGGLQLPAGFKFPF